MASSVKVALLISALFLLFAFLDLCDAETARLSCMHGSDTLCAHNTSHPCATLNQAVTVALPEGVSSGVVLVSSGDFCVHGLNRSTLDGQSLTVQADPPPSFSLVERVEGREEQERMTSSSSLSSLNSLPVFDFRYHGHGAFRLLNRSSLTLQWLEFRNGWKDSYGGVLSTKDSHLHLNGCRFLNNTVFSPDPFDFGRPFVGGAVVYADSSSVIVEDSVFENNTAKIGTDFLIQEVNGGAIYARAEAGGGYAGPLRITRSIFRENTASSSCSGPGQGGAIAALGYDLIFDSVMFARNHISRPTEHDTSNGGALYVEGPGLVGPQRVVLNNCRFTHNEAVRHNATKLPVQGGAVAVVLGSGDPGASVRLSHCEFTGNKVIGAFGRGGALFVRMNALQSLTIDNSSFSDNTAVGTVRGQGGGVAVEASGSLNLTVVHCRFAENHVLVLNSPLGEVGSGGAIAASLSTSTVPMKVELLRSSFVSNNVLSPLAMWGGAVAVSVQNSPAKSHAGMAGYHTMLVHQCLFSANVMRVPFMISRYYAGSRQFPAQVPPVCGGAGLAIFADDSSMATEQRSVQYIGNTAITGLRGGGGGVMIAASGQGATYNGSRHVVENCVFRENDVSSFSGEGDGGGLLVFMAGRAVVGPNSIVLRGVIFNGHVVVLNLGSGTFNGRGSGGAFSAIFRTFVPNIAVMHNNVTIIDTTFVENTLASGMYTIGSLSNTQLSGGAVAISFVGDWHINVRNAAVIRNVTFDHGAILCNVPAGANAQGGALSLFVVGQADVMVEECRFTGNNIRGSAENAVPNVLGGAVYVSSSWTKRMKIPDRVVFRRNNFYGNYLKTQESGNTLGGALFLSRARCGEGSLEIDECNFTDNYAASAGAVYARFQCDVTLYSVRISRSQFVRNVARAGSGGALLLDRAKTKMPINITDCVMEKNEAMGFGGAVYAEDTGSIWMRNITFRSNQATAIGGGMAMDGSSVVGEEWQATQNKAGKGEAFWISGCQLKLSRSELTLSDDANGGILVQNGKAVLPSSVKISCPVGAPLNRPISTTPDQIWQCVRCGKDHYNIVAKADAKCFACPNATGGGVQCLGGANINVLHGFQALPIDRQGQLAVLLCPGRCCPGQTCPWNASCAPGRDPQSAFCSKCIAGYSEAWLAGGECVLASRCGRARDWWIIVGVLILLLVYVLAQLFGTRKATFGIAKSVLFFFQSCDLVMVAGLTQAVTVAVSASDLHLGGGYGSVKSSVCLWPMNALGMLLLRFAGPFALFVVLLLCFVAAKIRCLWIPAARFPRALLSLALTAYGAITKVTFVLLDCRTVPGHSKLVMFEASEWTCYGQWFQIVTMTLLLPLVIVFPVVLLWFVRQRHSDEDLQEQPHHKYQTWKNYLVVCYRPSCYYWESMLMFRRLVLIALAVLIPNLFWRATILALSVLCLLVINIWLHPFVSSIAHRVENLALAVLCVAATANVGGAVMMDLGQAPGIPLESLNTIAAGLVALLGGAYVVSEIFSQNKQWALRVASFVSNWRHQGKKKQAERRGSEGGGTAALMMGLVDATPLLEPSTLRAMSVKE